MRPTAVAEKCTIENVARLSDYVIQPKLNGDRVILTMTDDGVELMQRHGAPYTFMVRNRNEFASLPAGTVLDGEVFASNFHPFETVGPEPVEVRVSAAKTICLMLGVEWLFDTPGPEFYAAGRDNLPMFEGIVAKRVGGKYRPTKKHWHESQDWLKLKWA